MPMILALTAHRRGAQTTVLTPVAFGYINAGYPL
jgi:hypothetical protein